MRMVTILLLVVLLFPSYGYGNTSVRPDTIPIVKTDSLREVVVRGSLLKYDAEGYRVNLSAIPQLKSLNLMEALAFLPGMEVDGTRISVFNKAVARVYVNRRRVRLTGEALASYLQSFEAGNIKEVKVVTSAGADVSATEAGQAIVRITTQRIDDGGQLTVSGSTFQARGFHTYVLPTVNAGLRYGRWSVYGNGSYRWSRTEIDAESSNTFVATGLQTVGSQTTVSEPNSGDGTLGVGYDLSDDDFLTAELAYDNSKTTVSLAQLTATTVPGSPGSEYRNIGTNDNHSVSLRATIDYTHLWKTGQLTVSGTISDYDVNTTDEAQREGMPRLWSTASATATDRSHRELQADVEQRLPEGWGSLKAGLLVSTWRSDDDTRNRLTQNGADNPFATFAEVYRYREQDYAAYASWQYQLRRLSASLGLRYEHREIDPQSVVTPELNHRSRYDNLYPSVQLGWTLSQARGHRLSLSYSHGVIMPFMHMLNPTVRWQSEYQYAKGNPFLQPASSDYVSGTLRLWHNYWVGLSWGRNSTFHQVYLEDSTPNLYYATYVNGESVHAVSLSSGATKQFASWLMLNGNMAYTHQTSDYEQLSSTSNSFRASLAVTSMLKSGVNIMVNGMYRTSTKELTFQTDDHWQLTGSLTKQLLNRRLTLTLNYFYVPHFETRVVTGDVESRQRSLPATHRVGLTVRYNLQWGKQMLKIRHSRGASEEGRRSGS